MKISTIIGNTKFSFDLLFLLLFLFLPIQAVLFFIFSVFVHELGHYITAYLFKYNIVEFRISLLTSFVQFEQKITKPVHSLLISLSGPFMNLLLAIYAYNLNINYLFAVNILLMVINLIPLRSTDGNYAFKSILDMLTVKNSQKISDITGIIISSILILLLFMTGEYILAASLTLMTLSTNIFK